MWTQSHPLSLTDQSWSKVDRKKERRNKALLSQPESQLSHFQPMLQSLQNDDAFTPASAPHDWPIQSERSRWSPSEASLRPVICPVQEVPTALQSPVHEYLPESAAQSAPPDEQVQLLPSELEKMSFQHNRAMLHRVTAWPDRIMDPRHTSLRCTAAQAATQQVLWQQTEQSCSSSQTAAVLHKR